MNNVKCPNCNVSNWSTGKFCIRCKSSLKNLDSPISNKTFVDHFSDFLAQTNLKNLSLVNLIIFSCLGSLLVCFLLYQFIKPTKVEIHSDNKFLSLDSQNPQKNNSLKSPEDLGVRSIDFRMIEQDSRKQVESWGRPDITKDIVGVESIDPNHDWTRKTYTTVLITPGCSNKSYNAQMKNVDYQQVSDKIIAVTNADVDTYFCENKTRSVIQIKLSYLWEKSSLGITQWKKIDDPNYIGNLIQKKEEIQNIIKEKEKEQEKRTKEQKLRLEKELEQFRQ